MNSPDRNPRLTTRGVIYHSNSDKVIECYVYVNFYVGWDEADADNAENVMSCTGNIIT